MPTKYIDYVTIKSLWKRNIYLQSQDKELLEYLKEKVAHEIKYNGKSLFHYKDIFGRQFRRGLF